MDIEFDFEIDDWMALHDHTLRESKQFKKSKLIVVSMMPLMMASIITIDFLRGKVNTVLVVIFTILSILWVIFYPKRMHKRAIKKTREILENGDNSGVLGKNKLTLNENGIIHSLPDSEQIIKWSGIKRLVDTETHYFLFDSAVSAIIIPKQKIENDLEQLDQLLKSKLL